MAAEFRILVLADVHYDSACAPDEESPSKRRCELGLDLIAGALADAAQRGGFDCVALPGDLLDDGGSPHAVEDLAAIRGRLQAGAPDVPLLVVPGNHDGDAGMLLGAFGERPGLHELGGYRFATFADPYAEGDFCTRAEADRVFLAELARPDGGPIVAIQHIPMNPAIASEYPYMLTNRDTVMRDYEQAGVLLSISGHYHGGQQLSTAAGVRYYTCPALCEAPFRYGLIGLRGRRVLVETRRLAPKKPL